MGDGTVVGGGCGDTLGCGRCSNLLGAFDSVAGRRLADGRVSWELSGGGGMGGEAGGKIRNNSAVAARGHRIRVAEVVGSACDALAPDVVVGNGEGGTDNGGRGVAAVDEGDKRSAPAAAVAETSCKRLRHPRTQY